MPNLKALICKFSEGDMTYLKEKIPHVKIGNGREMDDYCIYANQKLFWDD